MPTCLKVPSPILVGVLDLLLCAVQEETSTWPLLPRLPLLRHARGAVQASHVYGRGVSGTWALESF